MSQEPPLCTLVTHGCHRGIGSARHGDWVPPEVLTRVMRLGLESLFLWLVTWLGLAKKWLATWLGLARKWLVTNASQKLLERPRDLINFKNSPRPKRCVSGSPPLLPRKTRQNLPYLEFFKVGSFSLLFLFFLPFLLSLPLFSFTFYYIPLLMTGVEEIMCDLTCVSTKWLVTWLDLTSDQMTCDLTWTCKKWLAAISGFHWTWWLGSTGHGDWVPLDMVIGFHWTWWLGSTGHGDWVPLDMVIGFHWTWWLGSTGHGDWVTLDMVIGFHWTWWLGSTGHGDWVTLDMVIGFHWTWWLGSTGHGDWVPLDMVIGLGLHRRP